MKRTALILIALLMMTGCGLSSSAQSSLRQMAGIPNPSPKVKIVQSHCATLLAEASIASNGVVPGVYNCFSQRVQSQWVGATSQTADDAGVLAWANTGVIIASANPCKDNPEPYSDNSYKVYSYVVANAAGDKGLLQVLISVTDDKIAGFQFISSPSCPNITGS